MLVQLVPASVLPVVPARGPNPGAALNRFAHLGRSVLCDGSGRDAGRTIIQHRHAGDSRVPGRMGLSHAHTARARRHALRRHGLPKRRSHQRGRALQGVCDHVKVSTMSRPDKKYASNFG